MPNDRRNDTSPGNRAGRPLTRRETLRILGAGAVGAGLGVSFPPEGARGSVVSRVDAAPPVRPIQASPVAPAARPLPMGQVELLEGPFREARDRNARYMLSLDPDRLLHTFRVNAGLEPRAPVYGGWESQEPWVDIRCHGHTLGHWLTAGSLHFASTGDAAFQDRIAYLVAELAACQAAAGTGLVCAFPDGAAQLTNAVRGERFVGVPWYTMHKILAGLRDAYALGGSAEALEVLTRLADWTWDATAPMSEEGFQRMLRREHGGMNEVLADLYALTGEERYLTLAVRFSDRALLEPLARGEDRLDGLHSNTQIPKVVGFLRLHQLTGEEEYLRAAVFFWEAVVRRRSFATGGHGDVEHFFPPEEFPRRLGSAKTMETCCTHNMLRLTRMLFEGGPTGELADHYERALYNGILASQDPDSGWNTYFQATRPGYLKLYHTPIDSFWCCTGSGMENHAKYNDSVYFQGPDALWVNLFIPSVARWEEGELTLRQSTRFPEEGVTRIEITAGGPRRATLHLRHPGWSPTAALRLNGRPVPVQSSSGSFVSVEHEWRRGDVVELRLEMSLHAEALPGEPRRVAFLHGPIVLAGRLGREGLYPGADILRNERTSGMILDVPMEVPALRGGLERVMASIRPVEGEAPLTFRTVGIGDPEDVTLIPYYRLHHERYNLYWEVQP